MTRARPKTPAPWHPGLCARYVVCPALFVVAPQDEMPGAAPAVARDTYERLGGPREWMDIGGGHFGLLYAPSPEFDQASAAQARFLSYRFLGPQRPNREPGPRGVAAL